MHDYNSFRHSVISCMCKKHKIKRYTAEDIFHDVYEVYMNKVKSGEIDNTWDRNRVLNYILCCCNGRYVWAFGLRTVNKVRSKYCEVREKWNVDFTKIKIGYHKPYIPKHDYNLIISEINKMSPSRSKIYNMYLEDYSLKEIAKAMNTNKINIASRLYKIRKEIEPKIKKLIDG